MNVQSIYMKYLYHMDSHEITSKPLKNDKSKLFHHFGESYYVQAPSVFTKNNLLRINEVYDLVDFYNRKLHLKHIKLLSVYLKGYIFYIFGVDIDNGEFITRQCRLGFTCLNPPNSWT